jgi:beta-galactosidase/beta-glucuronidase/inosine-uridine nucleoside N-ribohydrolase
MKYGKWILGCVVAFSFVFTAKAQEKTYTIPQQVVGVKQVALPLNGSWDFRFSPASKWTSIVVPGEVAMQGYAIEHNKPVTYRKSFALPADYKEKRVILRFDGVYSYARLFVNGTFVREHHGGFTRWETDITSLVKPGKKNEIQLEVTDRLDEISYASGYAHHPIGGILRDVTIFVLPETHLYDFYVETLLDDSYKDAVLKIKYSAAAVPDAEIEYSLISPEGKNILVSGKRFALNSTDVGEQINEISVGNPVKWDAEHPNLYTLTAVVRQGNQEISRFSKSIGFRKIEVKGNKVLVNGLPVKWRGADRHDIHPTLGRMTTPELDSLDVILFKQSNMNYVRTSHYPPSEKFVEYCDRYGIYVECESAVCFVHSWRQENYKPGNSQDDPDFKERYLSQFQEMVKTFRLHPSVALWSIGNESNYGYNFQQCWDWVKATDTTRPVIFSYPGLVKKEDKIYDILSMHYPTVNGYSLQYDKVTSDFQGEGIPALFDEWAHPACYTYETLQEDPNIREFWGQSIDRMWRGVFAGPGALGGGIWGYIDEIFMLPTPKEGKPYWIDFARTAKPEGFRGNCVGYGEWGIVDVWRRQKPEFWATKKAYSPVKILETNIKDFEPGKRLIIPVQNRFDHTNLNEIQIRYTYKGVEKTLSPIAIGSHQRGVLIIPAEDWKNGEKITVQSYTAGNERIDADHILLGEEIVDFPQSNANGALTVEESADKIVVKGSDFEIPFSKATGLITHATVNGRTIIEKGPFLHLDIQLNHLSADEAGEKNSRYILPENTWEKQTIEWTKKGDRIQLTVSGRYGQVHTEIQILVSPSGKLNFDYSVSGEPNGYVHETGLQFYLPQSLDYLQWKRNGYWSYYPENAFGGNEGNTSFYSKKQAAYGAQPVQEWAYDTHDYFYWADAGANSKEPLTQIAKGLKENVWYYTLSQETGQDAGRLSVLSKEASLACRVNKRADEQLILYVDNRWDYPEIDWGNYSKQQEVNPTYGKMELLLQAPLSIIFDTDMGNDIDDALALDMLFKYQDQKRANLLGVMLNKDYRHAPEFIDIMATWYGYPNIPIGVLKNGKTLSGNDNNYTKTVADKQENGKPLFKRTIQDYESLPQAVKLYRKLLSEQPDHSVTIVSVGFSTNLARLLDTPADEYSPLTGKELATAKVKLLSVMAGNFVEKTFVEYNVEIDKSSARKVFAEWPSPIIVSPFELGNTIHYPGTSIENDFQWADHHPMVEAYRAYGQSPYNRSTWDLTAVLYAVEPDFFHQSPLGVIRVDEEGHTLFQKDDNGKHRYLLIDQEQRKSILQYFIRLITKQPAAVKTPTI